MSQGESFLRKDDTITAESFNDANAEFGIVLQPIVPDLQTQVFYHDNKPGRI